jgi:hypothetical protein
MVTTSGKTKKAVKTKNQKAVTSTDIRGKQVMAYVEYLDGKGAKTRVGWPGELISLNDSGFVVLTQRRTVICLPIHRVLNVVTTGSKPFGSL